MTIQIPEKIKTKEDYEICFATGKLIHVLSFEEFDGDFVAIGHLTNYFDDAIEVDGRLFEKSKYEFFTKEV